MDSIDPTPRTGLPLRFRISDLLVILILINLHAIVIKWFCGALVHPRNAFLLGMAATVLPAYLALRYITERKIEAPLQRICVILSVEAFLYGTLLLTSGLAWGVGGILEVFSRRRW